MVQNQEQEEEGAHVAGLEETKDGEDDIIDVAEARGDALLGVVKAAGPVDDYVVVVEVDLPGGADGGAGVELAELVEAMEDGALDVVDVEAA